MMSNLGGRPGVSAVLVDSTGTVLAAPPDQAGMIGRSIDSVPLLSAIAEKVPPLPLSVRVSVASAGTFET